MQDIWYQVIEFLPPIDRLRLLLAYPRFGSLISPSLDRHIKNCIQAIPGYGKQLFDSLKFNGLVVAGGYLLQCIMGSDKRTHKSSDIDVYCVGVDSTNDDFPGRQLCYKLAPPHLKHVLLPYELGLTGEDTLRNYVGLPISSRVYTYKDSRKLNMIYIGTSRKRLHLCEADRHVPNTVQEYVDTYFDFDFCKLTFDGEHLRISHPWSVVNRKSKVTIDVGKYWCSEGTATSEYIAIDQFTNRVIKYRKRGYFIEINPTIRWKNHATGCHGGKLPPYSVPSKLTYRDHLDVWEFILEFRRKLNYEPSEE